MPDDWILNQANSILFVIPFISKLNVELPVEQADVWKKERNIILEVG